MLFLKMRLAFPIVICVFFCLYAYPMRALAAEIRFVKAVSSGCKLKGVINATFKAPDQSPMAMMKKGHEATVGIVEASALQDLKKQAASLGANRIVIRDLNSSGHITYGARGGRGAKWKSSKIIAEAFQC